MTLLPNGNFKVAPGEVVTIAVTAVNTMYLAIFSDLLVSDWLVVTPPAQIAPGAVREIRKFTASPNGGRESFTLLCDFIRNPGNPPSAGAEYILNMQGQVGPGVPIQIPPVAPFPIDQQIIFEVRP